MPHIHLELGPAKKKKMLPVLPASQGNFPKQGSCGTWFLHATVVSSTQCPTTSSSTLRCSLIVGSFHVKNFLITLDLKCFLVPFCYGLLFTWGYWVLSQHWAWQTRCQTSKGWDWSRVNLTQGPWGLQWRSSSPGKEGQSNKWNIKGGKHKNTLGIRSS